MFHNLLIGYDGSAYAKKALEYGIDFAMHAGAQLTIATAFDRVPAALGAPYYDQLLAQLTAEARATADMAAEQARACGIEDVRVDVLAGPAAEAILGVAEARQCDCIVVGSRGRGQLAGPLLGSVSDRLANHARIPVLIVK